MVFDLTCGVRLGRRAGRMASGDERGAFKNPRSTELSAAERTPRRAPVLSKPTSGWTDEHEIDATWNVRVASREPPAEPPARRPRRDGEGQIHKSEGRVRLRGAAEEGEGRSGANARSLVAKSKSTSLASRLGSRVPRRPRPRLTSEPKPRPLRARRRRRRNTRRRKRWSSSRSSRLRSRRRSPPCRSSSRARPGSFSRTTRRR